MCGYLRQGSGYTKGCSAAKPYSTCSSRTGKTVTNICHFVTAVNVGKYMTAGYGYVGVALNSTGSS